MARLSDFRGLIDESISDIVPAVPVPDGGNQLQLEATASGLTPSEPIPNPPKLDAPAVDRFSEAGSVPGTNLSFGTPTRASGIPSATDANEIDIPTLLGTLAQAIAPDSIGGRLGKGIVGIQASEASARERAEDRGIRRLTAESQIGARGAAEEARRAALGLREDTSARAQAEVDRQSNVSRLFSIASTIEDKTSPEYNDVITQLRQVASPAEQVQLGLVEKQFAPKFNTVEIPGQTGKFGIVDDSGQFITDPNTQQPFQVATPGQLTPGFSQPTAIEGGVAITQTRGIGAGEVTKVPGISPPAKPIQITRNRAVKSLDEQGIPRRDQTERMIAAETRKLSPTRKKSLFDRDEPAVTAKSNTVVVINPDGRRGSIPRANLKRALAAGFKEVK